MRTENGGLEVDACVRSAPMASPQQYVNLARSLPPRLLRFFQRYPPAVTQQSFDQLHDQPTGDDSPQPTSIVSDQAYPPNQASTNPPPERPNPFQSQRHPVTGRWHDPVYSLRRQADLVKLAREHGVEPLLPFTKKGTQERRRRRKKMVYESREPA